MSNVVRETREKVGFTQQDLANDLRKSLRTITLWEARQKIDDVVLIRAMERTLQIHGEHKR